MEKVKVYVGNLAYSVGEKDLEDLFAQHGKVESVKVIMDRDTGRSKGFAFVEFANSEDAQTAMKALDGTDLQGRALKVNESKPQQPRPKRY